MQPIIESNAAELRKLHKTMHETSRHRSDGREALEAWQKACRELHDRWDSLAFPGGLRSGLNRIKAGDMQAIETAILYLELRPFYFRAQYTRDVFTRLIKRQPLPDRLQLRFDATRARLRAWRAAKHARAEQSRAKASAHFFAKWQSEDLPANPEGIQ